MIRTKIISIFNPDHFQGWTQKRSYFEGWYFKIVNEDETNAFAIIPGIAIDRNKNSQSFIQVLDGKMRTSKYHKFDSTSFVPDRNMFKIKIGNNLFSTDSLHIDLPELKGDLSFKNHIKWPNKRYSPGIMGAYSFLPFMECYHGIISLDHSIHGELEFDGHTLNFDRGRGYIEKDWGKSFPSAYVWLQSNHFVQPGISFKVSVAKIPYLGYSFVGFIAGLWLGDRLIQFTTYNRSRLIKLAITAEKVELVMRNKEFLLEMQVKREPSTSLASPIMGLMDGRIEESMNAMVEVKVTERTSDTVIFNDIGRNAGLEVAGKIEEIQIF